MLCAFHCMSCFILFLICSTEVLALYVYFLIESYVVRNEGAGEGGGEGDEGGGWGRGALWQTDRGIFVALAGDGFLCLMSFFFLMWNMSL